MNCRFAGNERYFHWVQSSLLTFLFSFQHTEDVASLFSCLQVFWQEVCCGYICSSVYNVFVSLTSFKIFSSPLVCGSLIILCSDVVFVFVFTLFGILWASWKCGLVPVINFWKFFLQFKLSLNCFTLVSFTSPSGIQITYMLDYLPCSVLWVFCLFSPVFLLCVSLWVIPIELPCRFLILSLAMLNKVVS